MIAGWFPESVSTYGGDVDRMFWLIFYIVGAWFVAAEGVLLYFAIRYRRSASPRAAYHRGDSPREIAWVAVPALVVLLLDLGIDVAGHSAWREIKEAIPPSRISVRVEAKQFNWEFIYPGPDGKFGTADDLTVENELHVPVGQVIQLALASQDVIHSLFVPNLRFKQDLVPGRTIRAWFEATKPGTYEVSCSELCGFGHYTMRATVIVHTTDAYRRWVSEHWPAGGASKTSAQSGSRTTAG